MSLEEALVEAHTIRTLCCDAPPVTAAIHRLLLAVLHRVFGPRSADEWARLWSAEQFDAKAVTGYLASVRAHFDLFDPKRPFFQCPTLDATGAGDPGLLVPPIASGNNVTLFDHHHRGRPFELTASAAARWLVTMQAFDVGGTKAYDRGGAPKDKYAAAAPLSPLACIQVAGDTLRSSLLLNLVPYDPSAGRPIPSDDDRPVWERTPPAPQPLTRPPAGYLDLLTWPSRRILLRSGEGGDGEPVVTTVMITPGDRWPNEIDARAAGEQMAAFIKNSKAKPGQSVWRPLRAEPERSLWRNATALLATSTDSVERPKVLDHLAQYRQTGATQLPRLLPLHALSLRANQSSYLFWSDEVLPLPPALLDDANKKLATVALEAVMLAEGVGEAISRCESQIYKHRRSSAAPQHAARSYWPRLDPAYSMLLSDLADVKPEGDTTTPARCWALAVRRAAGEALVDLVNRFSGNGRDLEAAAQAERFAVRDISASVKQFLGAVEGAT